MCVCQRDIGIFIHTERLKQDQNKKQNTQIEKGIHRHSRINHKKL